MAGLHSPCLGCISRCVGCHSTCKPYKEFDRLNQERRDAIRESKMTNVLLRDFTIECKESKKTRLLGGYIKMGNNKKIVSSHNQVRKATPEEVAKYNEFLTRESKRMNLYRDLGVSLRVTVEGNYSTTAH